MFESRRRFYPLALIVGVFLFWNSCAAQSSGSVASAADEWPEVHIGLVGQNRYSPQTADVLAGARAAAKQLGPRLRLHASVGHYSPEPEHGRGDSLAAVAQAQNEILRGLFVRGVGGVLIDPADLAATGGVLGLLERQHVRVVTFLSEAENLPTGITGSVVTDQQALGKALADEALALLAMHRTSAVSGVAVLAAASETAEPYAARMAALKTELAVRKEAGERIRVYGTYPGTGDLGGSLQVMQRVTDAERGDGLSVWVSVGGWPLLGYHSSLPQRRGLRGYVVAGGLPSMLPFLQNNQVFALVSPDYYQIGFEAMRLAMEAQAAATLGGRRGAGEAETAQQLESGPEANLPQNSADAAPKAPSAATAVQSPASGSVSAEAAAASGLNHAVNKSADTKVLALPPRIIRRSNFADYASQWRQWLAQTVDQTGERL